MRIGILIIILFIVLPFEINGQEKEWILNKDSIYTSTTSKHFKLYSVHGHISTKIQKKILDERELAYKQISDFLGININIEINIFLFQNGQLKYDVTGHEGYGWGFDNNIVEVYNDSIKVDPYHELVHILGYTLSKPPALIDEGLAVYLSQIYGDKPFSKLLGYPLQSINEILTLLLEK
ncbi:MAG: hypothetical protein GY790_04910, partial [Bacteroidetes bacterium]|nr:hypothetical protein [Bacteroidota bacterium]